MAPVIVVGSVNLPIPNRWLAEGVCELILSLGIKVTMREGKAKLDGRVIGPNYRLKFLAGFPAFRLPRKLIRQKRGGFRGTHSKRYITAVEPIWPRLTQCIQVDSPSHMYLAGREMIPTHNSGLLIGLALTRHKRSLLMRRQYTDLSALQEDCLEKYGSRRGYNGSPPAKLRTDDGRVIEFGSAKLPGDEEHWKGQPHDFLGIDEASQWQESQIRFLIGWVRSNDPEQNCRVVLATNPPHDPAEGQFLKEMFGPWLDASHPRYPAQDGEILWCVSDDEGKDKWVDGPEPVWSDTKPNKAGGLGDWVQPQSRTFIPASVDDNPFMGDSYKSNLDALPEPLRSAVRDGNWMISHTDDPWQVIPTNWILQAQERWTPKKPDAPMCAIGVDVAQGGSNETVLAPRYDCWFPVPEAVPGKETPKGRDVAALVFKTRENNAHIVIDMGGGYGSGPFDILSEQLDRKEKVVHGYKGSEGSAARTYPDRLLAFFNKRTETWWRFREALDPDQPGGSPIQLPPDPRLMADLTTPRFKHVTKSGVMAIQLESKEDIVKRLGRSPDRGDAVVMAWQGGPTHVTHGKMWRAATKANVQRPKTITGYQHRKHRTRTKR